MIDVEKTIISQYGNSPTITQLVRNIDLYLDPRTDFDTFFSYVWDVSTAEGFGLDIWGRIVGVERSINVPSGTPNPGMFSFTAGVYEMDDTQYRSIILVKALANITNCTAAGLNQLLSNLFAARGRCYVLDLGAMAMQIRCEFFLQPFEYVILTDTGIAPRPAGVSVTVFQADPSQTFGFAEAVQFQPFDQGTFYVS